MSPSNGLLVCGFTDRFIRLYDTRVQGLPFFLHQIYSFNSKILIYFF
jgi:hypothetical protein